MNTEKVEQHIRELTRLSLEKNAFARIRTSLTAYSTLHAVPAGVARSAILSFFAALITPRVISSFAMLFLVLGTGAGATLAAENAVPGEPLYAMKINFNERIAATLADTTEKKARHNAELAERRAVEAIALADEGKLDAKTAVYLAEKFEAYAEASAKETDTIESSGDVTTTLSLRTDLEKRLSSRAVALRSAIGEDDRDIEDVRAEDEEAKIELAEAVTARAVRVAAARMHTAASLLPGLADTDEPLDLEALRTSGSGSATVMSKEYVSDDGQQTTSVTAVVATTSPKAKVRIEVNANNQSNSWTYTNINGNESLIIND